MGRDANYDGLNITAEPISSISSISKDQGSVIGATKNRKFIVTVGGYLGLGPNGTQAGDEVYDIHGSNVPSVLRKAKKLDTYPGDESSSIKHDFHYSYSDNYGARPTALTLNVVASVWQENFV